MRVSHCHAFRVTRDADVDVREEEANDLLRMMEKTLRKRRFGTAVRLEVAAGMPAEMREHLTRELELGPEDVYEVDGPLAVRGLMQLYKLDRPELKDAPFKSKRPGGLPRRRRTTSTSYASATCSCTTRTSPSRPSTSSSTARRTTPTWPPSRFASTARARTRPSRSRSSRPCEHGKQATALVELKARFDEENNIEWAKRLEESGVHVVYGIIGLKTHCKVALVVRREGDGLRRYVHVATGNYNPVTSNFYTDLGLFTADEEIGADATDLFNFLTGFSRHKEYRRTARLADRELRDKTLALIRRETEHARAGRPARIVVKINRLADTRVIGALYEASQAGVPIDLIVRGICMLRPGVPGLSENIRVQKRRRPLSRTQPRLLLPERRRRGTVYGQRRLDAAQLRPARRDGRARQ